jgi:O-antigen/teichoic acid export membrane protein
MKIYVVGALSNILINLSLIPIYGLNGAIIGTILSYLIILFIAIYKLKDLKEVSLFNRGLDHKS